MIVSYIKPPDETSVDLSDFLVIVYELEKLKERIKLLEEEGIDVRNQYENCTDSL